MTLSATTFFACKKKEEAPPAPTPGVEQPAPPATTPEQPTPPAEQPAPPAEEKK
jgi:hypothetical protein